MRSWKKLAALAAGLVLAGTGLLVTQAGPSAARSRNATARLIDTNGHGSGTVRFTVNRTKTRVTARVTVPPDFQGFHGFHIHAKGVCDPKAVDASGAPSPFFTAGGHFDLDTHTHRFHSGDLPSVLVNGDGTADLSFRTDRFTVDQLFDNDGSAVIMHVGPDNFANIPTRYAAGGPDAATQSTGDSGGRLLCGVIK